MKVNLPTHVWLRRNYQLFFILRHWTYSKYKDTFHMLNVYEIPEKEHQVVDHWAADERSVSEILFFKYLEYASLLLCN